VSKNRPKYVFLAKLCQVSRFFVGKLFSEQSSYSILYGDLIYGAMLRFCTRWENMSINIVDYIDTYLNEVNQITNLIDRSQIAATISLLNNLKKNNGRLFILGVGGSAANASHAVNDFRKIAEIETYTPTDNVAELTAWTNDVGWDVVFTKWLKTSHLCENDMLLIYSVGGGSEHTSQNLVQAMTYAKEVGAKIAAIVSRDGGYAAQVADAAILIPVVSEERITPHAESWQAVVWHLIVNALMAVNE
jgi:D-sedoheptulose 7-phosphate isomerase